MFVTWLPLCMHACFTSEWGVGINLPGKERLIERSEAVTSTRHGIRTAVGFHLSPPPPPPVDAFISTPLIILAFHLRLLSFSSLSLSIRCIGLLVMLFRDFMDPCVCARIFAPSQLPQQVPIPSLFLSILRTDSAVLMQSATIPATRAAPQTRASGPDETVQIATVAKPRRTTTTEKAFSPATPRSVVGNREDSEYYYYRNPDAVDSSYVNMADSSVREAVVMEGSPIVHAVPVRRCDARGAPAKPREKFVLTTEMCLNMSACPRCRGQGCATCRWGQRRPTWQNYQDDMHAQGDFACSMM